MDTCGPEFLLDYSSVETNHCNDGLYTPQYQQYKKPGGENSKIITLENKPLCSFFIYKISIKQWALYTKSQRQKLHITWSWDLLPPTNLTNAMSVTSKKSLSKLQFHLPDMRHSCLLHSIAGHELVEHWGEYGWHSMAKPQKESGEDEGARSSLLSLVEHIKEIAITWKFPAHRSFPPRL